MPTTRRKRLQLFARAILKVLKAPAGHLDRSRLYRPVKLSEAFAQAGVQPLVARQSQTIIDPVTLAPRHNLLAGKPAVGAHNNAHLAPKALANGASDLLERLDRAAAGIALSVPQLRPQRDVAAKAVKGQVTIMPVVTVEECSFLVAMQRVVRGVKVQNDLPALSGNSFYSLFD